MQHNRDLIQFGREGKPGTSISETEKTALSIVSWSCAACSALLAGILVKLGRKGLAITASGLFIFGHFMTAGAKNIGTMLIGQVICGISLGFITTLTPLFLSELAPSSRRGTFVMMYVSLIALGQVAGSAVLVSFSSPSEGDNDNWRWPLFLLIIPAVVHFFLLLRIPDSPLCLARKGRTEEAAQLASSLYPGSESALLDVQDAVLKSAGHGSHYYGLIGKHRRTLVSGVLLQLLHQVVGMRAYSASCRSDSSHALVCFRCFSLPFLCVYVCVLQPATHPHPSFLPPQLLDQFSTARRNDTRFLHEVFPTPPSCIPTPRLFFLQVEAELGLDAVAFFVFVGITCIIPFVRRKKLLLVSTAGTFLALGVTGMGVVANIGLLSFAGVLCTAAMYASGIGCVPWIFNSEVYPLRYREVGMGAGTCAFWLGFIITDVLRCPFAGMFGADGSRYLVGSGVCLIALLWVYVAVPETAQVSVVHTEVLRSRKRSQGQEALRSLAETPSRSSCELDELNPSQAHPFSGLPSGREHAAHSSNAFAPPQRHSNVLHPSSSALHPATNAGSGNLLPLFDGPQSSEGPSQMGTEHVSH